MRFLVVKTSAGVKRAERILRTEEAVLQEAINKLEAIRFTCQPDAEHDCFAFKKIIVVVTIKSNG